LISAQPHHAEAPQPIPLAVARNEMPRQGPEPDPDARGATPLALLHAGRGARKESKPAQNREFFRQHITNACCNASTWAESASLIFHNVTPVL
jgi:hypothetical protein